jgi:pyrroloquinoline quinone biosynthesis protein B
MVEFLRANQPWASLLDDGYLLAEAVEAGETATVAGLGVTPVRVPHRGEHTDTVAWSIAGDWSLLYLPDIDDWGAWPAAVEILGRHDVCLLDGTFFDDDELTGRSQDDVRHPTVRDTVRRWPDLPSTRRVVLTHLNNTNPIADPQSPEAMWTKDSGFEIADDGMLLTG